MTYQEAKPFLKEGMKIRVNGYEGIITELDFDESAAMYEDKPIQLDDYWRNAGRVFKNTELEILTNPDGSKWVHPDQRFKIGDRVRIKRGTRYEGQSSKLGTIVNDDGSNSHPFQVQFDENYTNSYETEDLEKIEEPKTVTETASEYRERWEGVYEDIRRQYLQPSSFIKQYYSWDLAEEPQKGKSIMSSAVSFVKKQALKVSNPDEYVLREAGLHDSCGDLTSDGEQLRDQFLEELVKDKLVATAKDILAEREQDKK